MCPSKKEAEQSAAKKAWESLVPDDVHMSLAELSILQTCETYSDEPPSYEEAAGVDSDYHLPAQYADIEQYISATVGAVGGQIRKIIALSSPGRYKIEIGGSYRYCEKIRRHHKKNQIYFIVDAIRKTYVQRCHDPQCYGFQSTRKQISDNERANLHVQENDAVTKCSICSNTIHSRNLSSCERCRETVCTRCTRECDFCHSALHCDRCFDLCFDCHDS